MRTFSRQVTTFDEVPLWFLAKRELHKTHSVDLKRRPPKSRPAAPLVEDKLQPREAARKDSAVHVSLSSDSPVKQPGTLRLRPPPHFPPPHEGREVRGSRRNPAHPTWPQDHGRMLVHRVNSEGLRRRAIAHEAAARREGLYRLWSPALSMAGLTEMSPVDSPIRRQFLPGSDAARTFARSHAQGRPDQAFAHLAPYCGHIPPRSLRNRVGGAAMRGSASIR
jgi:hypothetical protein